MLWLNRALGLAPRDANNHNNRGVAIETAGQSEVHVFVNTVTHFGR
jgi:Flp pilus assembly protein TadD